ncbi:hypothetical protein L0244_21565, partial [bacterium]|nr:hypothetical protein [bacterium]
TVTLSAAGAFAALGPWSIVDRFRVDLNLGNMNLIDTSGYGMYLLNQRLARAFAPDGGADWTPTLIHFSAPLAAGANTWKLQWLLPLSANLGSEFDTGLIVLQAPEIQVDFSVRLNSAGANFVTNFSTLTNTTFDLDLLYYEVPDPNFVQLPPGQVVRTVEISKPFAATGLVDYTIERQGQLMQLISYILANGVRTDGIDFMQFIANINDTIYQFKPDKLRFLESLYYSLPLQVGTFGLDLWHSRENPSSGDDRDIVDSEVLTTLQWQSIISSGTAIGSGNNFFNTVRRILVNFQQPVPGLTL